MKKIIRLNEDDLGKLVTKIIKETKEEWDYDYILDLLSDEYGLHPNLNIFDEFESSEYYDENLSDDDYADAIKKFILNENQEKFTTKYKGYLTGSLVYLHKHKKELETQIQELDNKITNFKTVLDISGHRMSRDSHTSRIQSIIDFKNQRKKLQEELDLVNTEISKYSK